MRYKKEEMSPEWAKIKSFVGGATSKPKDPIQQEVERIQMRKPKGMADGGMVQDDELNKLLGGYNFGAMGATQNQPPPQVANVPPPPIVSRQTIPAGQPPTPSAVAPAPSMPTDYNQQASNILGGITPEKIQQLMGSLNQQANRGQIGAGIAGIGDAIASVGGIKGEHMADAESAINKNRELGMALPGQMAAVGKEQYGLSEQLQAKDPASPYSKIVQNSERPTLLKLGWTDENISKAPAIAIQDAVKNSLTYEDTQAKFGLEREIHNQTYQMQKATLENTRSNQQAEHEIQRQGQELQHPVLSGIKKFMGGGNEDFTLTHQGLPSGATYKAPDGTMRRKR